MDIGTGGKVATVLDPKSGSSAPGTWGFGDRVPPLVPNLGSVGLGVVRGAGIVRVQ